MTAHLHADARSVLQAWHHEDPRQLALRNDYLAHLAGFRDAMERSCRPGHLTASALVMSQSRDRVLLTLHPKVGRWLQLGGHCEPEDADLQSAAAREAREESGIDEVVLLGGPLRLDRHPVPCAGGMSVHLDVQYLAIVPDDARIVMSEESDDLRWFPPAALPDDADASVRALVADALRRN